MICRPAALSVTKDYSLSSRISEWMVCVVMWMATSILHDMEKELLQKFRQKVNC